MSGKCSFITHVHSGHTIYTSMLNTIKMLVKDKGLLPAPDPTSITEMVSKLFEMASPQGHIETRMRT